ncbi:hypothetical protein BSLA_02r0597 [Burkholderia stabilis]|nr:hypothetical protein BSLA_02r0597 [Burkholderia stabilis]
MDFGTRDADEARATTFARAASPHFASRRHDGAQHDRCTRAA